MPLPVAQLCFFVSCAAVDRRPPNFMLPAGYSRVALPMPTEGQRLHPILQLSVRMRTCANKAGMWLQSELVVPAAGSAEVSCLA
jgi:hypothetical protein